MSLTIDIHDENALMLVPYTHMNNYVRTEGRWFPTPCLVALPSPVVEMVEGCSLLSAGVNVEIIVCICCSRLVSVRINHLPVRLPDCLYTSPAHQPPAIFHNFPLILQGQVRALKYFRLVRKWTLLFIS